MLYTFSLPLACVQTSPLPQKKIHRHTQASLPLSARFFPPFSLNCIVPPMNHASVLWKATTSVVLEKIFQRNNQSQMSWGKLRFLNLFSIRDNWICYFILYHVILLPSRLFQLSTCVQCFQEATPLKIRTPLIELRVSSLAPKAFSDQVNRISSLQVKPRSAMVQWTRVYLSQISLIYCKLPNLTQARLKDWINYELKNRLDIDCMNISRTSLAS